MLFIVVDYQLCIMIYVWYFWCYLLYRCGPFIYLLKHLCPGSIKRRIELKSFTEDNEYLSVVSAGLDAALNEFNPDILVYNAGTDILDGDPLGLLSISEQVRYIFCIV